MQGIQVVHSIHQLCAVSSTSTWACLWWLQADMPEAAIEMIGPENAPVGIMCNNTQLLFPFVNIALWEVAQGNHMDEDSFFLTGMPKVKERRENERDCIGNGILLEKASPIVRHYVGH